MDLDGKRVLLNFTGTFKSYAMLINALDGLKTATPKRFRFDMVCVYVDFPYELVNSAEKNEEKLREGRKRRLRHIASLLDAARCKIPVYFTTFEQICTARPFDLSTACVLRETSNCFVEELQNSATLLDTGDSQKELSQLFNVVLRDEPSVVRNLVELLNERLLVRLAQTLECHAMLVNSSSDDLACDLLVRFATRRGAQVPASTRFDDARFLPRGAMFLRPFMLVRDAEIRAYLTASGEGRDAGEYLEEELRLVNEAEVDDGGLRSKRSIQAVTRHFVANLQSGFRATVFTALRSGEKIETKQLQSAEKCWLCNVQIIEEAEHLDLHALCTACARIARRSECSSMLHWLLVEPL